MPPQAAEAFLLKRRTAVLGPPVGKTAVLLLDDLNSAGRDMFGTQPAVELLRQWCAAGGWHDESNGTFKSVVDAQLLGCVTTSGYQKGVGDRFLQHVCLVGLPATSPASLQLIFTAMLRLHMASTTTVSGSLLPMLVAASLDLYGRVSGHMLPVPSRPHYLFSIRHVAAVFRSVFHTHRSSRATEGALVQLWQHECARVFQDRIVDRVTREWFDTTLHQVSTTHLGLWCPREAPKNGTVLYCTFASRGGGQYERAENVLCPGRGGGGGAQGQGKDGDSPDFMRAGGGAQAQGTDNTNSDGTAMMHPSGNSNSRGGGLSGLGAAAAAAAALEAASGDGGKGGGSGVRRPRNLAVSLTSSVTSSFAAGRMGGNATSPGRMDNISPGRVDNISPSRMSGSNTPGRMDNMSPRRMDNTSPSRMDNISPGRMDNISPTASTSGTRRLKTVKSSRRSGGGLSPAATPGPGTPAGGGGGGGGGGSALGSRLVRSPSLRILNEGALHPSQMAVEMADIPKAHSDHPLNKLYEMEWVDDGTHRQAAAEVGGGGSGCADAVPQFSYK